MANPTSKYGPPNPGEAHYQRRAEIVQTAARLIDQDGYGQTTMKGIADAAKLQKASVYHYFNSKAEILIQIHEDYLDYLFSRLDAIPESAGANERLHAVVSHIVVLVQTQRYVAAVFLGETRELPPEARDAILARRLEYRDAVQAIISEGVRQGVFRDVDPYYTTMTVFGMATWVYQWYDADPGSDPDRIVDFLWEMVQAGIGTGP